MGPPGLEPGSAGYEPGALPLSYRPLHVDSTIFSKVLRSKGLIRGLSAGDLEQVFDELEREALLEEIDLLFEIC